MDVEGVEGSGLRILDGVQGSGFRVVQMRRLEVQGSGSLRGFRLQLSCLRVVQGSEIRVQGRSNAGIQDSGFGLSQGAGSRVEMWVLWVQGPGSNPAS